MMAVDASPSQGKKLLQKGLIDYRSPPVQHLPSYSPGQVPPSREKIAVENLRSTDNPEVCTRTTLAEFLRTEASIAVDTFENSVKLLTESLANAAEPLELVRIEESRLTGCMPTQLPIDSLFESGHKSHFEIASVLEQQTAASLRADVVVVCQELAIPQHTDPLEPLLGDLRSAVQRAQKCGADLVLVPLRAAHWTVGIVAGNKLLVDAMRRSNLADSVRPTPEVLDALKDALG